MTSPWGEDPWGITPWGIGGGGPFALLAVQAIAENIVRMRFSQPVSWTGTGAPGDASAAGHYSFTPASGVGLDGQVVRAITPTQVLRVQGDPTMVDVYTDRPMSHYPCLYAITVANVAAMAGSVLLTATVEFAGVQLAMPPPVQDVPTPSRDIAQPDTLSAQLDPLPQAGDPSILGGIPVDVTGDYANDEGVVAFKKRMWRRLIAKPGGFAHLGRTYGAGLLQSLKTLSLASNRQKTAALAEQQILQEPEALQAKVMYLPDRRPGLFRIVLLVKTRMWGALRIDGPLVGVG
jgi:hypothetical protein